MSLYRFLGSKVCGPALPPQGWGVKVDEEREADHLHSSCAKVKNMWNRSSTLLYALMLHSG